MVQSSEPDSLSMSLSLYRQQICQVDINTWEG